MGGGGTSKQTATSKTSSTTTPPAYALPYAVSGLNQANNLANLNYSPYPYIQDQVGDRTGNVNDFSSLVAPINPYQQTALNNIWNYATAENPLISNSMNNLSNTISGQYLTPDSNPYLADYAQAAMGDVSRNYMNSTVPQYSAAASRAGAFGGSADTLMRTEGMRNLGDILSKTATNIYAPAYQQERQLQMQANSLAPGAIQMPLAMQTAALGVGDAYQQQEQAVLNDRLRQWQEANQYPFMAAQAGAQMFPVYGWGNQTDSNSTTSQTSKTPGASPFSQILGGALSLGGLALAPFTGGTSLLGTAAGGLSSLFGGGSAAGSAGTGSSLFGTSNAYNPQKWW